MNTEELRERLPNHLERSVKKPRTRTSQDTQLIGRSEHYMALLADTDLGSKEVIPNEGRVDVELN